MPSNEMSSALRALADAYDAGTVHEAAAFYHTDDGYNCIISPLTTDPHGFPGYIVAAVTFYNTQRFMSATEDAPTHGSDALQEFINGLPVDPTVDDPDDPEGDPSSGPGVTQ